MKTKELPLLEAHPELLTYLTDMYAAAQRSKVTKKKMGSIIVGNIGGKVWQILSDGCNGVPSGHDHVFENNGKTLPTVIHAEDNALRKIEQLISFGAVKLKSSDDKPMYKKIVLFVMSSPCMGCAKRIVESGFITDVIYVDDYRDQTSIKYLESELIEVQKVSGATCLDLMNAADSVKSNLLVSYMQENFTNTVQQALMQQHLVPKFADVYAQVHDTSVTFDKQTLIFDCQSFFKDHNLKLDLDIAIAIRYMMLSVAGVLSDRFEVSEINNVPPRGYDSLSNYDSMKPTVCKWVELHGIKFWADIVFRISFLDSVREILLNEDDNKVFTYDVGLIYHYVGMPKEQLTYLKLTPNISIVLIPL